MREKIKRWYDGKFVPYENDPNSRVFVGGGIERHWTTNLARWAVSFYMREWKWTLGALAAVVSVIFFRKF
jgi:hypothetical protein